VATKHGRYVQGGGCTTVGVPGLILGGGFGSFSKAFGLAAAGLMEAEIVTADGEIRIANPCTNPDLFWALKGGGGGFGVVTRVALRTRELPDTMGIMFATIRPMSDSAYRRLIGKIIDFYSEKLFNPHWGEQIIFAPDNLSIMMTFQGLGRMEAEALWRPFFEWVAEEPQEFVVVSPLRSLAAPGRHFWDPSALKAVPGLVVVDERDGAPEDNIFYAGNLGEAGEMLHAYQSLWLPAGLLKDDQRERLADALFAASKHWTVSLHVNKGLAGAPAEAIAASRDTAMNPAVVDAFALAISGAHGQPAYPGIPEHEPDTAAARSHAAAIESAMNELRQIAPHSGAYVWESNFFEPKWQEAYWGKNYARLVAVKKKYDPDGLFYLHHGPGSEVWSEDGFTKAR
jgi:hypothetical protein